MSGPRGDFANCRLPSANQMARGAGKRPSGHPQMRPAPVQTEAQSRVQAGRILHVKYRQGLGLGFPARAAGAAHGPKPEPALRPSETALYRQGLVLRLAHGRCLPTVGKPLKTSANIGMNEACYSAGFATAELALGSPTTVPLAFFRLVGPLESRGRGL
ncbi:hypothetical protein MC885_011248, partial [Smutsia gigantea]